MLLLVLRSWVVAKLLAVDCWLLAVGFSVKALAGFARSSTIAKACRRRRGYKYFVRYISASRDAVNRVSNFEIYIKFKVKEYNRLP